MKPTEDVGRILSVLKHPSIWPHIKDGNTPDDWQPPIAPDRVYLMPENDGACFVFSLHSEGVAEGHLCVHPDFRAEGDALAQDALDWLRTHTDVRSVFGFVKHYNIPACRFVERAGFTPAARLGKAVFYTKEL